MLADETRLWFLLRSLDDPEHLEVPASYDHHRVHGQFRRLTERLDTDFGGRCEVDWHMQDASLHGRIDIPAAAAATGRPLVLLTSNFGDLVVLAVDNPGVWTHAETTALLHPDDARRTHETLCNLGYTLIPEEPLWRTYDGVCDPTGFSPGPATWWTRYFDYL